MSLLFVLVCLFAAGDSFPDKTVQLAWFYKPPKDGKVDVLLRSFTVFILTHTDEHFRDQLKSRGARVPYLQYIRFDAIEDPGSCSAQPHRNQIASDPGDFCKIRRDHPDWFLYDQRHSPIVAKSYYFMDPGNAEWREYFLQRARQSQQKNGWDGVFLDNVEGGLKKRVQLGFLPEKYRDQASYRESITGFLSYLYQNLHPLQKQLWANIVVAEDTGAWDDYMPHLDGAMEECFAVNWSFGYKSPKDWEEQLKRAEKIQADSKRIILVAQGDQADTDRQQYAFASYLLVANGKASFRYTNDQAYGFAWTYPDYELNLGDPQGPRYFEKGFWRRKFANGIVGVNPSTHRVEFNLR